MTQQLDMFRDPEPEQAQLITPDGALIMTFPSVRPMGVEAVERKLARLREIEDRKREKKGLVTA